MEFLTLTEAARLLRVSRTTLWLRVSRGEVPAVRIGRVIRIPKLEFERWVESLRADRRESNDAR